MNQSAPLAKNVTECAECAWPVPHLNDGYERRPGSVSAPDRSPWFDRWIHRRIVAQLNPFLGGQILFDDGIRPVLLGTTASTSANEPLPSPISLRIEDSRFYRQVALGGSLGFAEGYLRRYWSTDDLTSLLRFFARNLTRTTFFNRGLTRLRNGIDAVAHRLARNTLDGSRRNIASHYDLSNEFFATFLDSTMTYSSARFEEPTMSLEEAATAKLDAVCRKLDLQPTDHLLEIGSGWGGLAIHAARNFGCRVTTTTISRQQYNFAAEWIRSAGLGDRITLLKNDYRQLSGEYDKLVSIEMLEAVGHNFLDTYFSTCSRLLKPGGRMLVQTITIPEQRFEEYARSVDFIQKYVFPGGCLPSVASIQVSTGRSTDLRLTAFEDFGMCYARTLREWRVRFFSALDTVRSLGFDDRFMRLWEYYLCYCEAAFLERCVGVAHLQWIKTS